MNLRHYRTAFCIFFWIAFLPYGQAQTAIQQQCERLISSCMKPAQCPQGYPAGSRCQINNCGISLWVGNDGSGSRFEKGEVDFFTSDIFKRSGKGGIQDCSTDDEATQVVQALAGKSPSESTKSTKSTKGCLSVSRLPPVPGDSFGYKRANFYVTNTCNQEVIAYFHVSQAGGFPVSVSWDSSHPQTYNSLWPRSQLPSLPFKPRISSPDYSAPILRPLSSYMVTAQFNNGEREPQPKFQYNYYDCLLYKVKGNRQTQQTMFYADDGSAAACFVAPKN